MSVSSQYSLDESLSPSSIGWSCCVRCKGVESLASGTSSASWFLYLVTMPYVLQYVPKMFSKLQGRLSVASGHAHVAVVVQVIGGKSHLPGNHCDEHGPLLCRLGASQVV